MRLAGLGAAVAAGVPGAEGISGELCPHSRRDGVCRSGCTQNTRLEEPQAGSGEGSLCSSSPHPVPKRALKPLGHLGASTGLGGEAQRHLSAPGAPCRARKGYSRLGEAPEAQDTRHGQPYVCNHCLSEGGSCLSFSTGNLHSCAGG